MTPWEEYRQGWEQWLGSLGVPTKYVQTLINDPKLLDFFFETVMEMEGLNEENGKSSNW